MASSDGSDCELVDVPPPTPCTVELLDEHQEPKPNEHLRGLVDMGSNGIRFSVTDLSPPLSRILPTVHVYRVDISLYDVQFDPVTGTKRPIPKTVIDDVVAALLRFKLVCADLGVPEKNIHVLATEATREAVNSAEFMRTINSEAGLLVDVLKKESEGRIGALGVASGFSDIEGIMMDLGGGSTQITWIISRGGNVRISEKGSLSFPYGAAALTRKIEEAKRGKSKKEAEEALDHLRDKMVAEFRQAYQDLTLPEGLVESAKANKGFQLYLSGGGFRGWGYLLLYISEVSKNPHPISIINGYTVDRERFENTEAMEEVARTAHSVFRVSDRRRKQVPAVAFLINVLSRALPHGIRNAHFCQGGVREGFLFQELPPSIRLQDPLEVATRRFAPSSADAIYRLILFSIPKPLEGGHRRFPASINSHVLRAFTNVLYVHGIMDKETASTAAIYSTSAGLMASTHGISHEDRARLALMLESRYMGELPPREVRFREELRRLVTPEEVWWAGYLGRVGYLTSRLYPAGRVDDFKPRVVYSAEWAGDLGSKRNKDGLRLVISIQKVQDDPYKLKEALSDHVGIIEKAGKKKNWPGGEEGWGMKVRVVVVEEDIL